MFFLRVLEFYFKAMDRTNHLSDRILEVCSSASNTNAIRVPWGIPDLIVYVETDMNSRRFTQHLKDTYELLVNTGNPKHRK